MNKKNRISIGILVILIVIFLITKLNNKTEKLIKFFDIDSVRIASIEISNLEDTLKLTKLNDNWMIDQPVQYQPEERKINDLFSKALNAQTSSIPVSKSEDSFETYKVTDSLGTVIKLFDANGNLLHNSIVGKSSNYNNTPVRNIDESKIYRLKSNISYVLKPDISSWRKKEIIAFENDNVSSIKVASDEYNYELTAADTTWYYASKEENFAVKPDNRMLENILNGLASIRANDFVDFNYDAYSKMFAEPVMTINVSTYSDEQTELNFVTGDKNKLVLKVNDETDHLYVVFESWTKNYQKKPVDFQK